MLHTKTTKHPESTRALAKRPESIPGGAVARLTRNKTIIAIVPRQCAGSQTPGHPPALNLGASDRRLRAGDGSGPTHQGKGRGGPGGLRVGRPYFPSCKRRKMQDARGSRRNKNTETRPPTRPRNMGETPGKRGKGTQPTQKKEEPQGPRGRENTARGTPPTQKKERKRH